MTLLYIFFFYKVTKESTLKASCVIYSVIRHDVKLTMARGALAAERKMVSFSSVTRLDVVLVSSDNMDANLELPEI